MKILNRSLLFCLAFALLASIANAETMEFTRAAGETIHMDACVRGENNGGTTETLFMGTISTTDTPRGYFGFDISALPTGATIDSVSLDLRGYNADAYGTTPVTFELRSTTAFVENTIIASNAPAMTTLLSDVDVAPTTVGYGHLVTWDSTTAFASAAQDAYDDDGMLYFAIKAEVEGVTRNLLRMTSLEGSGPYATFRPVLNVDYTVVPEPCTLTLLLLLLPFCIAIRWRRNRS